MRRDEKTIEQIKWSLIVAGCGSWNLDVTSSCMTQSVLTPLGTSTTLVENQSLLCSNMLLGRFSYDYESCLSLSSIQLQPGDCSRPCNCEDRRDTTLDRLTDHMQKALHAILLLIDRCKKKRAGKWFKTRARTRKYPGLKIAHINFSDYADCLFIAAMHF